MAFLNPELSHARGAVVWLTGLSGAGKSTLACALQRELAARQIFAAVLDGDELRAGLNCDLGFSVDDREESIRRAGEVALLVARMNIIAIVALISPLRGARAAVMKRATATSTPILEVYVDTPLSVCEERDPKSLYKRARAGVIGDFTGITSDYEPPAQPGLTIYSDTESVEVSAQKLLAATLNLCGAAAERELPAGLQCAL